MYLVLPELLMLWDRARITFSEFLLLIFNFYFALALSITSRLLLASLLTGWRVRVGALSFNVDGNLLFFPIANWYSTNPCTEYNEFFALMMQHWTANSGWQFMSSKTLPNISASTKLCLSTRPLLHGDSTEKFSLWLCLELHTCQQSKC